MSKLGIDKDRINKKKRNEQGDETYDEVGEDPKGSIIDSIRNLMKIVRLCTSLPSITKLHKLDHQ